MAYDVEAWSDFFVATAGATAALAGLLFVAVSINLDRILALPGVPERALGSLVVLLGALLAAILALAPGQSDAALGFELAGIGAITVAISARVMMRILAVGHEETHVLTVTAFNLLGTLPFLVAGLSLAEGSGGGLYWVLVGTVAAIAGAVANGWVLLVEVLR